MGLSMEVLKSTQFRGVLTVSICSTIMGFSNSYTGTALVSIKNDLDFDLDQSEISWVVSILSMGGCFGSAVGGPMIDFFGRKGTILSTGVPFILAYVFIGFADRVALIVIGRFLAGLCVGINSTAIPVFLGEILDAKIRGTLGIFPTAMGNGGVLLALVAGKFLDWRQLAYLGALLPIAFILITLTIHESPRFHASKNQPEKAWVSLQWYRGADVDITAEYNELLDAVTPDHLNTENGLFREIIKPNVFKPVFIILVLMTIQQFSGVNAIIAFIVLIFKTSHIPLDYHTCAIMFGFINFLAVFLAIPLIDKKGRKVLLYISDLAMIWSLLLFGAYFFLDENEYFAVAYLHWIPIVAALVYILGFSFGFGPVPWLMMGEILPQSIRGFAAGMLSSYNWLCASIIQMFFLFMLDNLGRSGTFWTFAGFCVLGFYFIAYVPETKGKSLEAIEEELMNDTDRQGFRETFNL